MQGFSALRKAVTTHVKKYDIVSSVFDIANQLLTIHSPFAPLGQVDEWTVKPSPFSIQGRLSEWFFRIMAAKTLKSPYCLQTEWRSNFSRRQCPERKTDSYVFSGFNNGIFHGWQRESTTGRFLTGWFWPCTWKISSVGKDWVENWEFCKLKITPMVWFFNAFFHLEP